MIFKGSKGKWFCEDKVSNAGIYKIKFGNDSDLKGELWCDLINEGGEEKCKANANLIASAPLLLDALHDVIHIYERDGYLSNKDRDAVKALIAKVAIHETTD